MPDEPSLGHLVNRTARLLRRLADQRLAPFGLSSGYLPVLTALMQGGALSQKALTGQAGIEQPTMAATLGRMERDGIIVRQADPDDRRSSRFCLSRATGDKVGAIRSAVEALNEEAVASLGEADRARLRHLLREITAALETALGE